MSSIVRRRSAVARSVDDLADATADLAARYTASQRLVGESSLDRLEAAARIADGAESGLVAAVVAAREAGWSWDAIGAALGVTHQGAQQRFGRFCATTRRKGWRGRSL